MTDTFKKLNNYNKKLSEELIITDREIAILDFNDRLAALAQDDSIPVMERYNFIRIIYSNIEEYLSVKYPILRNDSKRRVIENYIINILNTLAETYNCLFDIKDTIVNIKPLEIVYKLKDRETYLVTYDIRGIFRTFKIIDKVVIHNNILIDNKKSMINYIEREYSCKIKESFYIKAIRDESFRYNGEIKNDEDAISLIKDVVKIKALSIWSCIQTSSSNIRLVKQWLVSNGEYEYHHILKLNESIVGFDIAYLNLRNNLSEVDDLYYQPHIPKYERYNYHVELLKRDILIRHPYESYQHVIDFIEQMCLSADVKTIYQTIYRVDEDSKIINSLCKAAKSGKDVNVYIEISARGDEVRNLQMIKLLKDNGCNVFNSYYGYKVHTKAFLAITKDKRYYSDISTGNFNEVTSSIYVDISHMSANKEIGLALKDFFKSLMNKTDPVFMRLGSNVLFTSPNELRDMITYMIDRETEKGTKGRIFIKCNNLSDGAIIYKLTSASEAGVRVRIICRSACSIIPYNKNIIIRSKAGKFLEHDRIYVFGDDYFISSADLLLRNLSKRIELMLKIENPDVKDKLTGMISNDWTDMSGLWTINMKDLTWHRLKKSE